jgi:hypothetical protein
MHEKKTKFKWLGISYEKEVRESTDFRKARHKRYQKWWKQALKWLVTIIGSHFKP